MLRAIKEQRHQAGMGPLSHHLHQQWLKLKADRFAVSGEQALPAGGRVVQTPEIDSAGDR